MPKARTREAPPYPQDGLFHLWRRRPRPLDYLFACGYVAAATAASEILYRTVHTTRLSLIFLTAVMLAAATLGAGPAIFTAGLAVLTFNFYLVEPRFTLRLASDDYVTLAVFLSAALLMGGLAGRLRDENAKARARNRTLGVLFDASRQMSAIEAETTLRDRLAELITHAAATEAWVMAPGAPAPADFSELEAERLRQLIRAAGDLREGDTLVDGAWRVRRLSVGGLHLGSATWRAADGFSHASQETDRLIRVLADLGAAALARARLSAQKSEAEAVAQAEQLRTALLSSISHDFRTPLAAILASATTLTEFDDRLDAASRRDLAQTIQEETERLNRFVANLLNMTKLESGALDLRMAAVSASEVVSSAADRIRRRRGAHRVLPIQADGQEDLIMADPLLLEQAITNLVENAVAFSPEDSKVSLSIRRRETTVEIEVADHGPGVPAADLTRIFEKFYRAPGARRGAAGTGLGLSIVRALVEAMGGTVIARPRPDGDRGLSMLIRLKAAS